MTPRHVPVVVAATMRTPLAADRPPHLDGILYAARFDAEGPSSFGRPLDAVAEERGIPRASMAFVVTSGPAGLVEGEELLVRSFKTTSRDAPLFRLDGRRHETKISKQGPWRLQVTRHPVLHGVASLVWFALGDPELIEADLEDVWCLGSMHGQGFGEVARWEVVEVDADPADVGWFRGGRPIRRMPVSLCQARLGLVPSGVRRSTSRPTAPYWATDGACDCVEPTLASMTVRASRAFELRAA